MKEMYNQFLIFLVASKVVWSDFAAVLGDQNAKEIIANFRFLIKKNHFLETMKTKEIQDRAHTACQNRWSPERPK